MHLQQNALSRFKARSDPQHCTIDQIRRECLNRKVVNLININATVEVKPPTRNRFFNEIVLLGCSNTPFMIRNNPRVNPRQSSEQALHHVERYMWEVEDSSFPRCFRKGTILKSIAYRF